MYDGWGWRFRGLTKDEMRRRLIGFLAFGLACGRVQVPPTPVTEAVSAEGLERRLTAFAHDSMMGREAGTIWNLKATDYVAAQFRALGVTPAGERGGFFQTVEGIKPRDATLQAAPARNVIGIIPGSDPA